MKIALDATYSLDRQLTGVGVYSRAILCGLAQDYPAERFVFCYRPHRVWRSFSDPLPNNVSRALLRSGGIRPWHSDLFHALNQRVDQRPSRRVVSTFHDLFVISGDYSTPEFRRRFADQARKAAERSDLIIAVSQFTADQVEHLLHVDSSRIRVVHHGVDRPLKLPDPALRQPVILHVGAIQKRKNIVRLVEAFETLRSDWRLILAGGAGFGSGDILDRIARSPRRSSIEWTGYVDAGRLEELYARASIFAFPSLDEGFGMPVLDAMAHGVPVLTSGHGALKEVSGDAALHIDPEDSGSISNALHRLTESEALRTELTQAGLEHCSAFSWDIARRQTWRVYKDLE